MQVTSVGLGEQISNQCRLRPRIGKLSPPCGPWNDSTKMHIIGPYRNST